MDIETGNQIIESLLFLSTTKMSCYYGIDYEDEYYWEYYISRNQNNKLILDIEIFFDKNKSFGKYFLEFLLQLKNYEKCFDILNFELYINYDGTRPPPKFDNSARVFINLLKHLENKEFIIFFIKDFDIYNDPYYDGNMEQFLNYIQQYFLKIEPIIEIKD